MINVIGRQLFAWLVCAKNSLINSKRFSPYQLVLGRNVNLPTVLSDKLPAFEGQTESSTVAEHLSSLQLPRNAFIMAESSEKIRRALCKQTRQTGTVLLVMKFIIKEVITISGKV